MSLSEITTVLSGLAVLAGALSSFFAIRVQRDMANLKNEILEAINDKYISRNEAAILNNEQDKWQAAVEKTMTEQRDRQDVLREEFIRCQAQHGAVKE
jgi:hypothetical protein